MNITEVIDVEHKNGIMGTDDNGGASDGPGPVEAA